MISNFGGEEEEPGREAGERGTECRFEGPAAESKGLVGVLACW
jgi:hypothetical protein